MKTDSKTLKKEKVGEAFEKLVTAITTTLERDSTVKHDIQIIQPSGAPSRIDVLVDGVKRILIECKDKKARVKQSEMNAFIFLCQEAKSEGVFVSKAGFQSGAKKNGSFYGIKMFTLEKIKSEEFERQFNPPKLIVYVPKEIKIHFEAVIDDFPEGQVSITDPNIYNENKVILRTFEENTRVVFLEARKVIYNTLRMAREFGQATSGRRQLTDIFHQNIQDIWYVKKGDQYKQIRRITFKVDSLVEIEIRKFEYYLHQDLENNIVSETVRSDFKHDGKPYTVNIINFDKEDGGVFLIPSSRDSEIIELENLGEIKDPFIP